MCWTSQHQNWCQLLRLLIEMQAYIKPPELTGTRPTLSCWLLQYLSACAHIECIHAEVVVKPEENYLPSSAPGLPTASQVGGWTCMPTALLPFA
jgi:hypothetical protein